MNFQGVAKPWYQVVSPREDLREKSSMRDQLFDFLYNLVEEVCARTNMCFPNDSDAVNGE